MAALRSLLESCSLHGACRADAHPLPSPAHPPSASCGDALWRANEIIRHSASAIGWLTCGPRRGGTHTAVTQWRGAPGQRITAGAEALGEGEGRGRGGQRRHEVEGRLHEDKLKTRG